MNRLLTIIATLFLIGATAVAAADNRETARIGILAYRGSDKLEQKWYGLKHYLGGTVAGWNFELVPITLSSAGAMIENGELDFLLTNPGHFADLNRKHPMSVIASRLQRKSDGTYANEFGSAIIVRADSGITLLQHVSGKSVAAVDRNAFGGFQLAWQEFENVGVDLFSDTKELSFVGFPMDQIIKQVLSGEADVGIVRSGLVEEFIDEQLLKASDLAFLNSSANYAHPDQTSTRLYPEWPFAAFSTTNAGLRDKVAIALLSSQTNLFAQESGMIDNWSAPVPYHAVEELAAAFRQRVEQLSENPMWRWMVIGIGAIIVTAGLAGVIYAQSRRRRLFQHVEAQDASEKTQPDAPITKREQEILGLISEGNSTKEIAITLGISPKTVEFHRSNLLRKHGARTSSQLIAMTT